MKKLWDKYGFAFSMSMYALFGLFCLFTIIIIDREMQVELKEHDCVKTGNSRASKHIQYIYGAKGQITGAYQVNDTKYEYTCNDKMRWY